ncbi:MAG: thioredoxin family protein [Pyrinomonadaceae bacterium]
MATKPKRQIEIFSAGCATCKETIKLVQSLACESCEIKVHDMNARGVAARAKKYGVQRLPAIVINEKLAECCVNQGIDVRVLRSAGLGVALT